MGIRVAGDASLVEGNVVTAKASALAVGIVAGFAQATGAKPVDRVTVANNTVQGVQNGIAISASRAPWSRTIILERASKGLRSVSR